MARRGTRVSLEAKTVQERVGVRFLKHRRRRLRTMATGFHFCRQRRGNWGDGEIRHYKRATPLQQLEWIDVTPKPCCDSRAGS